MVVDQLKEMMPLKTVGKCYEVDCDEECMKNLDRQYYFYMAFEDSVCPNYLSEMFWRIKRLVVPIVLSRAVVPSEIPSYTYIAVDDFPTLREFVGYLFEVVKDRELYKRLVNLS
jgi:alpha-1,3-fucosyltransferase